METSVLLSSTFRIVIEKNDGNSDISCNTFARRSLFGRDGWIDDSERGFEYMYVYMNVYVYVCIGSLSHGRRTLLSVSISFCRLADLKQEAPCADTRTLERIS